MKAFETETFTYKIKLFVKAGICGGALGFDFVAKDCRGLPRANCQHKRVDD